MWAIQFTLVVQLSLSASSNFCLNCLSASSSLFPKARESWKWREKIWFYIFSVVRCESQSLQEADLATQHTPCPYSNTIYGRENEHQGMVIIWPLPEAFWRWNEFMITARQLLSCLSLPLLCKTVSQEMTLFHSLWTSEWNRQVRLSSMLTKSNLQRKEVYTLRYCISLTDVSSGSPAVNISAKRVMKRFPCRRKIRYASSQHWRNL